MCVVCREPARNYDCQIELGNSKLARAAAKLACISQIARTFGHAKCALRSDEVVGACLGQPVAVTAKGARLIGEAAGEHGSGAATGSSSRAPAPVDMGGTEGAPDAGQTQVLEKPRAPSEENHGETQGVIPAGSPDQERPSAGSGPAAGDVGTRGEALEAASPVEEIGRPSGPSASPPADQENASDAAPPKTVEELAKRAARDSAKNLEKAGETVEGAARKTWECLTSLFTDCLP